MTLMLRKAVAGIWLAIASIVILPLAACLVFVVLFAAITAWAIDVITSGKTSEAVKIKEPPTGDFTMPESIPDVRSIGVVVRNNQE